MSTWTRARLKWLATEVRDTIDPAAVRSENVFHYSIPSLDERGDGAIEPIGDIGSNKLLLHGEEVLISKLNPRITRVLTASQHPVPTLASTEFIALVPGPALDSRFLCYWLQGETARQFLDGATMSVTRSQQRVRPEVLTGSWVDVPNTSYQRAIADYLDRETARIDALVAAKRRMVQLLEERVWLAFSARLFASDPETTQLRRALRSLIDGPFGSAFTSSDYSDDGAVVIRLGNIGFSYYRATDEAHIPLLLYERFTAYRVVEGDLLIAGLGDERNHAGRACVAPELGPAIVKGKCFRARVDQSRANAEFLSLLLSSPLGAEAMNASGRGSTRSMINLEIVKTTDIPLPTIEMQASIVADTRTEQARTAVATGKLTDQIDLLQERRRALVTAAVTGQLHALEAA